MKFLWMHAIDLFYYFGNVLSLVKVWILILCIKNFKLRSLHNNVITYYVFLSLLEGLQAVIWKWFHFRKDIAPEYIFTFMEFLCFGILIYDFLKTKALKVIANILAAIFILTFFLLKHQSMINQIVAEDICLLLFCLLFYIEIFLNPPTIHLANSPTYWFVNGGLIYFGGTLPLFLLAHHILSFKDRNFFHMTYFINILLFAALLLFIMKSIKCLAQNYKSQYS